MADVDIVTVVSHYLELTSNNKACCPFHDENTPSFTVSEDDNFFHCFGCGAGGDAFEFVKRIEDCSFKESIPIVGKILGCDANQFLEERPDKGKPKLSKKEDNAVPMSPQEIQDFQKGKSFKGKNYRGIKDQYLEFYRHLTEFDSAGKVKARYYPETRVVSKGKTATLELMGYKCRNHPKDFSHGKVGTTGKNNQLSGQHLFKARHKYCLIVGGEEDKVAAYQMLCESSANIDKFAAIPVVSPTCGESSAAAQVASNLDWFDLFDNIMVCMDNDEAGIRAAKEVAAVLPKDKVRVMTTSGKDPNWMLENNQTKQFARDFYNSKPLVATGVKSSDQMMEDVIEELMRDRIPLPKFMKKANIMTGGGFKQGIIVNIIGNTSIGKSTLVNSLVYDWIFNSPVKVGVISLEATAGQYGLDMLSIHLERNFVTETDGKAVAEYLQRPEVVALHDNLWNRDDGQPRWSLLDERDGDIDLLEKQMEKIVHKEGCGLLVIDVLSDILRGCSNEDQDAHMRWQKQMIKSGVTIINVLHTRKPMPDKDGNVRDINEYDAIGSGSFVSSSAINILLDRDKMSDDNEERNTTRVRIPKCRGGTTGDAGAIRFDPRTRLLYDLDEWRNMKAEV